MMAAAEFRSPLLAKRKGASPGPLTRRMRSALCPDELKLSDPKSLLHQMASADAQAQEEDADADFQPGAESEVEEEFDEGDAERDDERPPFADGGLAPADPTLLRQLEGGEGGEDEGADYSPADAAAGEAEEIAEEYDEGPVVDDERPPFEDADVGHPTTATLARAAASATHLGLQPAVRAAPACAACAHSWPGLSSLTSHHSLLTSHHSLLTTHFSPLAAAPRWLLRTRLWRSSCAAPP